MNCPSAAYPLSLPGPAHEHEVAVQTTPQPGNCSPPPGTYRSGAIEYCLFRFQVCHSSVLFSSVTLRLSWPGPFWRLASHQRPRLAFQKVPPLYRPNLLGGRFISEDPLHGGVRRSNYQTLPPWPLEHAVLLDPLRSIQFSSVQRPLCSVQFSGSKSFHFVCNLRKKGGALTGLGLGAFDSLAHNDAFLELSRRDLFIAV